MSRPASLFLRFATVCLFLGLAWIHMYWAEATPYAKAIEQYGQLVPAIEPQMLTWGFGGWFLAAALSVIVGRPSWLFTLFVLLSMIPLSLLGIALFFTSETPYRTVLGNVALLATPLILCFGVVLEWRTFSRFLARLALTVSFATFGVLAMGLHYEGELPGLGMVEIGSPQPEEWNAVIAGIAPELDPLKQKLALRVGGGIALLAAVGIWSNLMVSISAIALSLLALGGSIILTTIHLSADTLESLHRWAPETILRFPLVFVPIALWQMKQMGTAIPTSGNRRKLRRVESPTDDFEIIMEDDDRFVSVDEIR